VRTTAAASPSQQRQEGQRVTVRPLAGMAVGTTLLTRRVSIMMHESVFSLRIWNDSPLITHPALDRSAPYSRFKKKEARPPPYRRVRFDRRNRVPRIARSIDGIVITLSVWPRTWPSIPDALEQPRLSCSPKQMHLGTDPFTIRCVMRTIHRLYPCESIVVLVVWNYCKRMVLVSFVDWHVSLVYAFVCSDIVAACLVAQEMKGDLLVDPFASC
jgi:hypothetical protein